MKKIESIYKSPFPSVEDVISDIFKNFDSWNRGTIYIFGHIYVGYNVRELFLEIPPKIRRLKVRKMTSIGDHYNVDHYIETIYWNRKHRTIKTK